MTATKEKKKRDIAPPRGALFTIVVNKKSTKVSDKELRSWTGRAEWALLELFTSARITPRFELFHDAKGSSRLIHVEAKAGVHRVLELFDEQKGQLEINAADAGERIVQQAKEELVRFVKASQRVALKELEDAARRIRPEPQSFNRHLVEVVKTSEQGRLHVATHGTDHLLTVYLSGGVSVLEEKKLAVVAKVLWVGATEAVVMPEKISRNKHAWLRSTLRIQLAPALARDELMTRLYVDGVRKGLSVIVRGMRIRQKDGRGGSRLYVEQSIRFRRKASAD